MEANLVLITNRPILIYSVSRNNLLKDEISAEG